MTSIKRGKSGVKKVKPNTSSAKNMLEETYETSITAQPPSVTSIEEQIQIKTSPKKAPKIIEMKRKSPIKKHLEKKVLEESDDEAVISRTVVVKMTIDTANISFKKIACKDGTLITADYLKPNKSKPMTIGKFWQNKNSSEIKLSDSIFPPHQLDLLALYQKECEEIEEDEIDYE